LRQPPALIDGARVVAWAGLATARPTGATRHSYGVPGDSVPVNDLFAGIAVARYDDEDDGWYLFYCDADWRTVTDTWHETYEAAVKQAAFEFEGVVLVEA